MYISPRWAEELSVVVQQFPAWTECNWQDDLFVNWQIIPEASGAVSGNTYTYRVDTSAHNNESGVYTTHIYAYDKFGNVNACSIPDVMVPCLDTAHQQTNTDGKCDFCGWSMLTGGLDLDGDVDSDDLTCHTRYVGGIITDWNQE